MKPVVVLSTCGIDFDARGLARELVELRVAACVNIVPRIHSVYRWDGAVTSDDEQLLVIKTVDERVDALRDTLLARHPYEVPEFVVLPIEETSDAYGAWILDSLSDKT